MKRIAVMARDLPRLLVRGSVDPGGGEAEVLIGGKLRRAGK